MWNTDIDLQKFFVVCVASYDLQKFYLFFFYFYQLIYKPQTPHTATAQSIFLKVKLINEKRKAKRLEKQLYNQQKVILLCGFI